MPENTVAVVFTAPERLYSNDNDYQYHQSPNFYYLSGFTEPNSMLLIFKSPFRLNGASTDEILFVPDRNPERESWNGRRAGEKKVQVKQRESVPFCLLLNLIRCLLTFPNLIKCGIYFPKGMIDAKNAEDDLHSLFVESFKRKTNYPPSNGDVSGLSLADGSIAGNKTT